jgi:squalene-hopene/tetraprenyl-beta-curcumene cyclase
MSSTASQCPDPDRIRAAYEKVCRVLLDWQTPDGHWIGRLSASALSTATAISAFSVFLRSLQQHNLTDEEFQQLESLIPQGVDWLLAHQNSDGGWGDSDKSVSNVSTTLLVKSALVLAMRTERVGCRPPGGNVGDSRQENFENGTLSKADAYLQRAGGIDAIKKRYGEDQTFSVPILTNAALAGLVEWKDIPQLPFELAALPMSWFRFVKMNVVSYAIPALVAIGQVRFHFYQEKGRFIGNFFRRLVKKRTLRLIQDMQPESGGYLEAAPLTSFVVMSLSAMGQTDHPIVTKGIRFLLQTVREDGSWAIDTNLATWLTSLSITALQSANPRTIDWLLSCQHKHRHPFTGAAPGGWGWTDLSGGVPDADDTAGALLALASQSET